jgi:hypothetical protein
MGELRYSSTHFYTSAVDGGGWSGSRPCRFTPGERAPGTHWIRGWVSPGAGVDVAKRSKSLPFSRLESNPDHPSRSLVCILTIDMVLFIIRRVSESLQGFFLWCSDCCLPLHTVDKFRIALQLIRRQRGVSRCALQNTWDCSHCSHWLTSNKSDIKSTTPYWRRVLPDRCQWLSIV